MLRILGSPKRLCGQFTRRDFLRVGGLGLAGATLPQLAAWQQASAAGGSHFGRAKGVILIHLYGSPSQIEWVDPKPQAPVEIRGELGSIPSSLPGCHVGELFPKMAKVMDRVTVLRSLNHPYPIHGVAFALTGAPITDVGLELSPRDPRHWPFFGSVVDYVLEQQADPADRRPQVPRNMLLPWAFSSRRVGEVPRAGPYASYLGTAYDPVATEFVGKATRGRRKKLGTRYFEDNDPYMGVEPNCYFEVPGATRLQGDVTLDRLDRRRRLLEQLDQARRHWDRTAAGRELNRFQQMAYELMNSPALRKALDIRREPEKVRRLYGYTLFGQGLLAARRLIEAGAKVVTLFWDEYGLAGSGWDTHWNHYPRMKKELAPGFDQGWYGLITDLDSRGLLDEVLVVCTSEHGRTPKLKTSSGGGRDHWARAYSSLVAGAGVARGRVVGASDRIGGDVADRPISPKDLLATMYHLLGIDPHLKIRDRFGRPTPLVEGNVIAEALA